MHPQVSGEADEPAARIMDRRGNLVGPEARAVLAHAPTLGTPAATSSGAWNATGGGPGGGPMVGTRHARCQGRRTGDRQVMASGLRPGAAMPRPHTALRSPVAAAVCLMLGALALLAGALLTDAGRLLRPDTFADRAAASLGDVRVANVVANLVTDAVLAQQRDLVAYRPLLLTAAQGVVASDAFRGLARGAARQAYAALVSNVGRSVVFSLDDLDVVLRNALAASPEVARALPNVVAVPGSAALGEHPLVRAARLAVRLHAQLPRAGMLALLAGALLLAAGGWCMPDRRDALVGAGAALLAVGLALWATVPVGAVAAERLADDRATGGALAGLWTVAMAGLRAWGFVFGATGVVLAAAGSSLLERLDVAAVGRRVWQALVAAPPRRSLRLVRGGGLTSVGIAAALAPRPMLSALVVLAGVALAFVGLRELFAVVLHAAPAHARIGRALASNGEGWAVGGVLVVVLAALFGGAVALTSGRAAGERAPTSIGACNGAAFLCDRRLDEVVLAGTHNAMSSADHPGWLFAEQERGLTDQLEDGIRALLIDVHHGTPAAGRVRTDMSDPATRATAEGVLGPEGTAAAMRIRDRLVGAPAGERALYLCHGFCELGAARLDSALRAVHDFLVRHPNEVLVIVIEDYVPPAELARAFETSGLAEFVYRGRPGTEWPTLRTLIARDARVVAMIESGRGGVPWLLPAFGVMQETPYSFANARDTLSCAPNRGGTSGALFQVNHWITTPPAARPSNAATVNTRAALLERVRRCERERGRRPTILAVDFYRTGDLLDVTRSLNAAGPPSRSATGGTARAEP